MPPLPTVQRQEYVPRIPSPAEVQQLLDAIPWRLRGQWLARSQLGLRPSEAQRANVSDWRFEPETFRLPDGSELRAHILTVRGKGGRVRMLPVPASWGLAVWIGEHCDPRGALRDDDAPLFVNPEADPHKNPAGRWMKASSRRVWLTASNAAGLLETKYRPRYTENEASATPSQPTRRRPVQTWRPSLSSSGTATRGPRAATRSSRRGRSWRW